MKTKTTPFKLRAASECIRLDDEFTAGRHAALKPSAAQSDFCVSVIVSKRACPGDRAFWSGYACQLLQDREHYSAEILGPLA